jgi:hypothetical protein
MAQDAQATADVATCRAVDAAIVGYTALNQAMPTAMAELKPFLNGDITAYRIEKGVAAGPGCQQ